MLAQRNAQWCGHGPVLKKTGISQQQSGLDSPARLFCTSMRRTASTTTLRWRNALPTQGARLQGQLSETAWLTFATQPSFATTPGGAAPQARWSATAMLHRDFAVTMTRNFCTAP